MLVTALNLSFKIYQTGNIFVNVSSRRDISKVTNEELPRALEVCPEVTLKQCDPKGFKEPLSCATLNIQDFECVCPSSLL